MKSSEILVEIKKTLRTTWDLRPGRTVPELERVTSGNHGIEIDAAVLYADMKDSTKLVDGYKAGFAAEMYKSYLYGACKVIGDTEGEVTAFDGDRVMGVFMGSSKNTSAVKCALKIHYLVKQINAAIAAQYPSAAFTLEHTVGIDTSKLLVAKTGVRTYNDLVWVGPAANYAAKMATLNDAGYPTFISEATYKAMNKTAKFGDNGEDMWESRTWRETGKTIYRSSYWWSF